MGIASSLVLLGVFSELLLQQLLKTVSFKRDNLRTQDILNELSETVVRLQSSDKSISIICIDIYLKFGECFLRSFCVLKVA